MTGGQLSRYQAAFQSSLLGEKPDAEFLDLVVKQSKNDAPARVGIYRNNVQHSLSAALADLYPVTRRLIGEQCFRSAAVAYVRKNPPEHAAMVFYGESFIDFIAGYPACSQLEYLADTARLEWCCHLARNAGDAGILDPSRLTDIPDEKLGRLRLVPHPSVRLMESRWPVDDIQLENLKEDVGIIDLAASAPRHLLIWRDELEVRVIALTGNCYRLLAALSRGQPLDAAWQGVFEQESPDELAGMLGYLLGLRLFIDFRTEGE